MPPTRINKSEPGTVDAERIVAAARGWIGTPYHHGASRRGVGCDCLGLVRGVWRELYAEEPEAPGPYTGDWSEATGAEALLAAARRHMVEIRPETARPGDVLVFRIAPGRQAKHMAILAVADHMIHAQEGAPAAEVPLSPWWRRRIAGCFRLPVK